MLFISYCTFRFRCVVVVVAKRIKIRYSISLQVKINIASRNYKFSKIISQNDYIEPEIVGVNG